MMITSLGNGERISCPKPQDTFERSSESKARDHVARPMRQHHDPRQRKRNRDGSDHPARLRGQGPGGGSQRSHMQRVAGGKSILGLAGKRNAVNVAEHGRAIRTNLIKDRLESVRQERCRHRDEERVVARALHGLLPPP